MVHSAVGLSKMSPFPPPAHDGSTVLKGVRLRPVENPNLIVTQRSQETDGNGAIVFLIKPAPLAPASTTFSVRTLTGDAQSNECIVTVQN